MRVCLLVTAFAALSACAGADADGLKRSGLVAESIGEVVGPGRCGIANAYRVSQAGGIHLSPAARMSRKTANRLDFWVREHAVPIVGKRGGGLVGIKVAAHYACRTRNSRPGARLSEHAKGNAIDISAFFLADGTRIEVLSGWNDRKDGKLLRRLHASACGPFGTVLGPDSDRFHRDHFHFDLADYRRGAYCR